MKRLLCLGEIQRKEDKKKKPDTKYRAGSWLDGGLRRREEPSTAPGSSVSDDSMKRP